ncbi:hypothetical protein HO133_000197 [Letharia lupina]|uniref:Uncharacterized protein n=1 Tax=Letharia lupina TaxID=560253 RepID=A0A8H6FCJ9_9LECA|nr:uncharacterized protein HO133_000197 [Letharia lupina]KAF6223355.1 hypothetical protein HO133_000197 [Letharia lupina]
MNNIQQKLPSFRSNDVMYLIIDQVFHDEAHYPQRTYARGPTWATRAPTKDIDAALIRAEAIV